MEDVTGPVVGCSSKMYAAFTSHRLLERTWWLLAKHTKVVWLTMDRNVVDPTEATGRWRDHVNHGVLSV